jgi:predicted methyltransferase
MPIIERAITCRQRPVSRRYNRIGSPRCKIFKVLRPGTVVLIFDHWQPPNESTAKLISAMRRPRRNNFG